MKNMFIPYELAVKAYEKGFEIKSYGIGWYYKRRSTGDIHGLDTFYIDTNQNIQQWESIDEPVEAILYQQLLDWLREKHNILITIELLRFAYDAEKDNIHYPDNIFKYKIIKLDTWFSSYIENTHQDKDYYEALNKAIKEALKLI